MNQSFYNKIKKSVISALSTHNLIVLTKTIPIIKKKIVEYYFV